MTNKFKNWFLKITIFGLTMSCGEKDFISSESAKDPEQSAAGGVTGKVTLAGQSDHAGIHVYIPGTAFDATTDSSGTYTISSFVPAGTNNLYFEKDGYYRGQIEGVEVVPGENTAVQDIILVINTGSEAGLIIENNAEHVTSHEVQVTITQSGDSVLMKSSEDNSFTNTTWEPFKTPFTYKFDSDGKKTLYVLLTDANGLESEPFSADVFVDTTPPEAATSSHESGVYGSYNLKKLTFAGTEEGGSLYYTIATDGSTPDTPSKETGILYNDSGIQVEIGAVKLKAITYDKFGHSSEVSDYQFEIQPEFDGNDLRELWFSTRCEGDFPYLQTATHAVTEATLCTDRACIADAICVTLGYSSSESNTNAPSGIIAQALHSGGDLRGTEACFSSSPNRSHPYYTFHTIRCHP